MDTALTPAQRAAFEALAELRQREPRQRYLTSDKRIGLALLRKGLVEAKGQMISDMVGTDFGRGWRVRDRYDVSYHLTDEGERLLEEHYGPAA